MFKLTSLLLLCGTALLQKNYLHKNCLRLDQTNLGQPNQKCELCNPIARSYKNSNTCSDSTQTNCALISQANTCLRCNPNYQLNNGNCVQINSTYSVDNCQTINSNGLCTQCKDGYGVSSTGTCFQITKVNVTNCINYDQTTMECIQCSTGYYLSDNKQCPQMTSGNIQNCISHGANSQGVILCLKCADKYTLNVEKSKCVAIPNSIECLYASNYTCTSCADGYIMSQDAYKIDLFNTKQSSNLLDDLNILFGDSVANTTQMADGVKICVSLDSTANCDQYSTYNTCKTCKSGYYMNYDTNRCIPNPLTPIPYCLEYSSSTTCSTCQQRYYPNGSGTCTPIGVTDQLGNCVQYNQKLTTKTCTLCATGYYVSNGTSPCTVRTNNNISRCLVYHPTQDECQKCEPNFSYFSGTPKQCLESIPNCTTYDQTNLDINGKLICTQCDDMFYISRDPVDNSTVCLKNTIPNCIQSHPRFNYCNQCANQYFGYGTCNAKHNSINLCLAYNPLKAHICTSCQDNSIPIIYKKQCVAQNQIANCDVHTPMDKDSLMCRRCKPGYYSVSPTICSQISSTTNCDLALEDGICIRCLPNFALVTNPSDGNRICMPVLKYASNDCEEFNYNTVALDDDQFNKRFDLQTSLQKSRGLFIDNIKVMGQTQSYNHYCLTCKSTATDNGTDYLYLYRWSYLAPSININYCIEKSDNMNKVNYLYGSEYLPIYPENCMIYGPLRQCFRCAAGYYKLSVGTTNGYTTVFDKCVAKDTTHGGCKDDQTGSQSLVPVAFTKSGDDKKILIDKYEYCTTKKVNNTTNYDIVQGQDVQSLMQSPPVTNVFIALKCRQFITAIPTLTFANHKSTDLKYSNINPFSTLEVGATKVNWIKSHLDVFPEVTCIDSINTLRFQQDNAATADGNTVSGNTQNPVDSFINGGSRDIALLEFWYNFDTGSNSYARARCGRNKKPTFNSSKLDGTNGPQTYVQCVSDLTSSDTVYDNSIYYNNMIAHDQYFMNIHACKNNKIPFMILKTKEKDKLYFDGFVRLYKNVADWKNNSGTAHAPIICVDISTLASLQTDIFNGTPTGLTTAADFKQLKANCAYGLISSAYDHADISTKINENASAGYDQNNKSHAAITCRACKPGYKPNYFNHAALLGIQLEDVVIECTQITNCASDTDPKYLNSCTKCNTGFVLAYKVDLKDQYTECATVGASFTYNNCYLYDVAGTKCRVCNPGYYLTKEDSCESIVIKNCTGFQPPIFVDVSGFRGATSLIMYQLAIQSGAGCQTCTGGDQLVNIVNSGNASDHFLNVCGVSSFLSSSGYTNLGQGRDVIYKCLKFGKVSGSDGIKCKQCKSTHVVQSDYSDCLINTNLANCEIASNADDCQQCKAGFKLIKDGNSKIKCTNDADKNVTNCDIHFFSTTAGAANLTSQGDTAMANGDLTTTKYLCNTCTQGYYLTLDGANKFQVCTKGIIKNCQIYKSQYKCKQCSTGYQLFTSTNANAATQYDSCIPVSQDNTCASYSFDLKSTFGKTTLASDQIEATCTKCSISYGQILYTDPFTTADPNLYENYYTGVAMAECRKIDLIANCARYGSYQSFTLPGGSNDRIRFGCTQCLVNYYLNPDANSLFTITADTSFISDSCVVRTYVDNYCLKYKLKEDKCDTCAYGYYLDVSGKCKQSPSGILNCSVYQNNNTCIQCSGDFYLINNQCLPVATSVTNCIKYKSDSICEVCSAGTFIDPATNKCLNNTLANCVSQLNSTTCSACGTGYSLNSATGTCVQTPNCLTTDTNGGCRVCNSGYYPDANAKCVQVSPLINNCSLYKTNTQCSQCSVGYALDYNAASCIKIDKNDSQCTSYILNTLPQCQACASGYNYIDGKCQPLPLPEKAKLGCLVFNGDKQICLMCLPGYAMTFNGLCQNSSSLEVLAQPYVETSQDRLLR